MNSPPICCQIGQDNNHILSHKTSSIIVDKYNGLASDFNSLHKELNALKSDLRNRNIEFYDLKEKYNKLSNFNGFNEIQRLRQDKEKLLIALDTTKNHSDRLLKKLEIVDEILSELPEVKKEFIPKYKAKIHQNLTIQAKKTDV